MTILHVINDMKIGGAQRTLEKIANEDTIFTLKPISPSHTLKLFLRLICVGPETKVISWLYHANLFVCLIKCIPFVNFPHIINIRNGLADPTSLKPSTVFVIKWVSRLAKHNRKTTVIYCSQSAKSEHESFGLFADIPYKIVRNGISQNWFISERDYSEVPRFCMVARFEPQKNYDLLKQIIPFLEDNRIKLDILTDREDDLRSYLNIQKNSSVTIYKNGIKTAAEIFSNAECSLLLSTSEGFANVNLEALASGCDIISTNVGDADIYPEKWVKLIQNDKADLMAKISVYCDEYRAENAHKELLEKQRYLASEFPQRKEEDYV